MPKQVRHDRGMVRHDRGMVRHDWGMVRHDWGMVRHDWGNGYTFLEVIVVLAIIGILSALAVPGLSAFTDRLRIETTARTISTDLREVKMKSVLDRSDYTVLFDPGNSLYELPERQSNLPHGVRFGFGEGVLGPPGNPTSSPDEDGVTFTSNKAAFYSRGSNSMGTIYITDNYNVTMAISVNVTGRIKIWKWNGVKWS